MVQVVTLIFTFMYIYLFDMIVFLSKLMQSPGYLRCFGHLSVDAFFYSVVLPHEVKSVLVL